MITVGCAGFPVPATRYFKEFLFVEVQETHVAPPGSGTVRRWRREAPEGFRFAMVGPRGIGPEGSGAGGAGRGAGRAPGVGWWGPGGVSLRQGRSARDRPGGLPRGDGGRDRPQDPRGGG